MSTAAGAVGSPDDLIATTHNPEMVSSKSMLSLLSKRSLNDRESAPDGGRTGDGIPGAAQIENGVPKCSGRRALLAVVPMEGDHHPRRRRLSDIERAGHDFARSAGHERARQPEQAVAVVAGG